MWSQEPGSIHCCLLTSHLALNPAFPRARSLPRWIPGQVSMRVEALEGGLEGEGCMLVDVGISLPFRSFPSSAPGAPGGDGQRGCQVQVLHRSLLSHLTELLSDSCPVSSPSPAPMALTGKVPSVLAPGISVADLSHILDSRTLAQETRPNRARNRSCVGVGVRGS